MTTGPGPSDIKLAAVVPDELVESRGVPLLISDGHCVKLDIVKDRTTVMLLLEPAEAIHLGKQLYSLGRAAARAARKDPK